MNHQISNRREKCTRHALPASSNPDDRARHSRIIPTTSLPQPSIRRSASASPIRNCESKNSSSASSSPLSASSAFHFIPTLDSQKHQEAKRPWTNLIHLPLLFLGVLAVKKYFPTAQPGRIHPAILGQPPTLARDESRAPVAQRSFSFFCDSMAFATTPKTRIAAMIP